MRSHFFAYISRMRFISRWALMRNTAPENVQEHSHETAVLAHALAVIRNRVFGGRVDPGAVAAAALYHDASEIITGDLPTPIKYCNPVIRDAYKEVEDAAGGKLLSMDAQRDRAVFHGSAHMVAGLQNGGGDGGQGVKHRGGGTGLEQAGRQRLQRAQTREEETHHRVGQHGKPHGGGNGHRHIQLQHRRDLPVRLPPGPGHGGGHDAGDSGGRKRGGNSHRQVDELVVLGVEHALPGTDGLIAESLDRHVPAAGHQLRA